MTSTLFEYPVLPDGTTVRSPFVDVPCEDLRDAGVDACDRESHRGHVQSLLNRKIEFVYSSEFDAVGADRKILGEVCPSDDEERPELVPAPPGTLPYLAALYEIPLLTRVEEHYLFRKMNYLKYRADSLRERIDRAAPQEELLDQVECLLNKAHFIRNGIARANLRLVVSIARTVVDRANLFEDLVSEGNLPLLRAIEIFDFNRGNRFSTYATWAIRNRLYRSSPRNRRHQQQFRSGEEAPFYGLSDHRDVPRSREDWHHDVDNAVRLLLDQLDERDRQIVISRFGLGDSGRPQRFREIGEELGISTERARQLFARSLERLKGLADRAPLDIELD